jgi:hypothetical protein
MTDVATMSEIVPFTGLISRGSKRRLRQKIPRGGIHAVLRLCSTVMVDCETYSTQQLQKMVRARLTIGATIHPKRENRMCDREGI